MLSSRRKQSGQSLVIAMGLFALAGIALFFVFKSHRAVDEKMNLVNAADAAAFSGAQMAARQLNFMALTNRTMIANEVAIGHQMAYQVEMDLVSSILAGGFDGLMGVAFNGFIDLLGGDFVVNLANNISRTASGVYMLGVNSANSRYAEMQESEYRALAGIGKENVLNVVMSNVASRYVDTPNAGSVSIVVNDAQTLATFEASPDSAVAAAARSARTNPFCAMVMFAKPSAKKTGVYEKYKDNPANEKDFESMDVYKDCERYYRSGAEPGSEGSLTAAAEDGGVFLEMLNASAVSASPKWVATRNENYKIGLGVVSIDVERRGQTQAVWDSTSNQIDWKTTSPDTIRTTNLFTNWLLGFDAQVEGSAKAYADYGQRNMSTPAVELLKSAGLCDSNPDSAAPSCDDLDDAYAGPKRFAIANPMMGSAQPVTAFLTQRGNCNDNLGVDDQGKKIDGWKTDQPRFGSNQFCDPSKQIYAYASARVFFERPPCESAASCKYGYGSGKLAAAEKPNLFNPFWQARLGY